MKRVMIVDDSLIIRMNLKKILEKVGFQIVCEATNGQEAVDKYCAHRPDLVTMDITMPVMDGIRALERIRAVDADARIVMISALGQEEKMLEALQKGARHYFVKPVRETDVVAVVESIFPPDSEGEAM